MLHTTLILYRNKSLNLILSLKIVPAHPDHRVIMSILARCSDMIVTNTDGIFSSFPCVIAAVTEEHSSLWYVSSSVSITGAVEKNKGRSMMGVSYSFTSHHRVFFFYFKSQMWVTAKSLDPCDILSRKMSLCEMTKGCGNSYCWSVI